MNEDLKTLVKGGTPSYRQEFGRWTREICGKCGGSGYSDDASVCDFCKGTGKLIKEVVGELKIYPDLSNIKISQNGKG